MHTQVGFHVKTEEGGAVVEARGKEGRPGLASGSGGVSAAMIVSGLPPIPTPSPADVHAHRSGSGKAWDYEGCREILKIHTVSTRHRHDTSGG